MFPFDKSLQNITFNKCIHFYFQVKMIPRISYLVNVLKILERNIFQAFGYPPRGKTN